ncbi:helix-turn-helix domain-containing protein [Algibacillus agarilyticus]|uniref:helix-turn-helix domain-containing protein n=1 Tax=Algibacillus agarilyticus TaxID=2234133 RepID=UPI000DCFAC03|nr:helix-turn-helix domain-containing protein [Algibacillus agarilyticus]
MNDKESTSTLKNTDKPSQLGKRIVEQRAKQGLSQEALADMSGLSLRTIQRIEKGESIPRGATLKKLAQVLTITAEDLIDVETDDAPNMLVLINLSQLACLLFPLLGILAPLIIWLAQRNRIQQINALGVRIVNFQILWNLLVFATYGVGLLAILIKGGVTQPIFHCFVVTMAILYLYVIVIAVWNTTRSHKQQNFWYKPVIPLLQ